MNSENNNEGLNSISLGNMEPNNSIPPVMPNEESTSGDIPNVVPPVTPIPVEPVPPVSPAPEQSSIPMPQVDNIPMGGAIPDVPAVPNAPVNNIPPVAPVSPINEGSYDVPDAINNFNPTPFINDIGTVPPIPDAPMNTNLGESNNMPKKNKGMNKTIFVLIIVLALAAVGVGVYIMLNLNKATKQVSVVLKQVQIEVGNEVSNNINDYATFININSATCSLDTSKITDTKVYDATYDFTITCNGRNYVGKARIVDSVNPEVTTNNVTVGVDEEVKVEDFIQECKDNTTCTYKFKDEEQVKNYVKQSGTYDDIVILVSDSANNTIEVKGTLIVEEAATLFINCKKNGSEEVTKFVLDKSTNQFNGQVIRENSFTLTEEEYYKFKTDNNTNSEVTYEEITGQVKYDDENYVITISRELTQSEIESEYGEDLPKTFSGLRKQINSMGYSCSLGN